MEKKFQSLQTAAGHYKCRICCNNLKNCKKCEKRVDIPWYRQYTNEVGCGKRIRRIWGLSSAGRASALQAEGHRFEPCRPHLLNKDGFPSGQRGQTVNLLAPPSKVRILLPPLSRSGGTGRRAGLKILFELNRVPVRFRSAAFRCE